MDEHVSGIGIPGRTPEDIVLISGTVSDYVRKHTGPLIHQASNNEEILLRVPDIKVVIDAGLLSGVSCVLRSQERHVGILHVRSCEAEAYGEAEVTFIESVADTIAGSLASEQLRRELEGRAEEEAALAAIGQTITSSLDIADIYPRLAKQVGNLVQFDRLVISLVDKKREELVDEYVSGIDIEQMRASSRHPLVESPSYLVIKNSQSAASDQKDLESRAAVHKPTRLALDAGLNSMLIVPLLWRDSAIGTLNFRSKHPDAYGVSGIRMAEAVAAQISGALENSRLYVAAERAARVRTGIANIGRIVNSSVTYDDVFEQFVVAARELVQFDRVVISVPSTHGETFLNAFVSGTPVPGHSVGQRIPIENSIFDAVAPPHGLLTKTAVELDESKVKGSPEEPFVQAGLISRLLVPLMWSDRMVGTLSLRSSLPAAYGEEELEVALEIAAQISGVIATSRLHDENARTAAVREGLSEIGRIVSSSLSIEDVYAQFAEEAQKIIAFDRVMIMLRPFGSDDIEIAFVHGVPMDGSVWESGEQSQNHPANRCFWKARQ